MHDKYGETFTLESKCRICGTEYGERAPVLFSYCLWCNALMCCATPEGRIDLVCGYCKIEDSAAYKFGVGHWRDRVPFLTPSGHVEYKPSIVTPTPTAPPVE